MKRMLGVAMLLMLVASAASAQVYLNTQPVPWRVNNTTACNPCDSTYKTLSMVGTTAIPDTSKTIFTGSWAWGSALMPQVGSITTGALYAIGRVSVVSENVCVANDTLFLAVDSSPDGTNWNSGSYIGYGQGTTGGTDQCMSAPIVVAIGATTAGSASPAALSQYIRLRIRPDGATTAVFTAAKLYVSALKSRLLQ
jgi:hypothetical protein